MLKTDRMVCYNDHVILLEAYPVSSTTAKQVAIPFPCQRMSFFPFDYKP